MKNVVLLVLLLSVNFIKAQTLNIKRISKEDSLLAEKLFTQGLKFYDNDKFDDAYINFDKSLNINPKKQESYYYRADIKKIKGDLTGALIDFSFLVSIGNNFLETYLQKAEIELILKKYKESIEDYTKVLSFNPKTNLSYYYTKRGYCYKKLGNYIDALKDFNIAINKNPKMNSLYLDKSEICFKLSMFDESVFNATKYINSGDKEELELAYYYRGLSNYNLSNIEEAIPDLLKIIDLYPAQSFIPLTLGISYKIKNDSINSYKFFNIAIKREPNNPENYFEYGNAKLFNNECTTAIDLYDKYLDKLNSQTPNPLIYCFKAKAIGCIGDTIEALKNFEKALQLVPEDRKLTVYFKRLELLYFSKSYMQILIDDIGKVIELTPKENSNEIPNLYTLRAFIKTYAQDTVGAEKDLQMALELSKKKGIPYYNLAGHYYNFRFGDSCRDKVINYLKSSIETNDSLLNSYKFLAVAYCTYDGKAGYNSAKKTLKQAELMFGKFPKDMDIINHYNNVIKIIAFKKKKSIEFELNPFISEPSEYINLLIKNKKKINLPSIKINMHLPSPLTKTP